MGLEFPSSEVNEADWQLTTETSLGATERYRVKERVAISRFRPRFDGPARGARVESLSERRGISSEPLRTSC